MNNPPTRVDLLLSLQRALLDEVHAELRDASTGHASLVRLSSARS